MGYAAIASPWTCREIRPSTPSYLVIASAWSSLYFVIFRFFIFFVKWWWTRWWFRLRDITITIVCVYKSKKYALEMVKKREKNIVEIHSCKRKFRFLEISLSKNKQKPRQPTGNCTKLNIVIGRENWVQNVEMVVLAWSYRWVKRWQFFCLQFRKVILLTSWIFNQ